MILVRGPGHKLGHVERGTTKSLPPPLAAGVVERSSVLGVVRSAEIVGALKKREDFVAEIKARLEALGGEGLRFLRPAGSGTENLATSVTAVPPPG
jgi:hypothetical protein